MELKERIKKIREEMGNTQSEQAMLWRDKTDRIKNLENGKIKQVPIDLAEKVVEYTPYISLEYLLFGKGELYRQSVESPAFDKLREKGAVYRTKKMDATDTLQELLRVINEDDEVKNLNLAYPLSLQTLQFLMEFINEYGFNEDIVKTMILFGLYCAKESKGD